MFKDMKIRTDVHTAHKKAYSNMTRHKVTSADRGPN